MKFKFYSWNVNGLRATAQKDDFWAWLKDGGADLVAMQETKASPDQLSPEMLNPLDYLSYWCASTRKKGYSGVGVYARQAPLAVTQELPDQGYNDEGRLLHLEYEKFHFFNIYFPNGQKDETRLKYKLEYYDRFLTLAQRLRAEKPIVVCGDFNTAHHPIDLARPKENEGTSGFLPIERAWLDKFTAAGYIDTLRLLDQRPGLYSWWSFRSQARARNVGWRIDYFFVSEELKDAVTKAWIEPDVFGSDHCPIGLELEL